MPKISQTLMKSIHTGSIMSPAEALYEYQFTRKNSTKHLGAFRVKSKISDYYWAIAAVNSTAANSYALSLLRLEGEQITWPKQKSRYLFAKSAPDLAHLLPAPADALNITHQLLAVLGPDGEPSEHGWDRALHIYGQYSTIYCGQSLPSRVSPVIQGQQHRDSVRRHFDQCL